MWQEARFVAKRLLKERRFTIVVAATLGLGIGINAIVFACVNAILIRSLPFDRPDEIVALGTTDGRGKSLGVSQLDFQDWQDSAKSFEGLAVFIVTTMNISENGRPAERFAGTYGSANIFHLIAQRPVIGRDFRPEDDRPDIPPSVILSYGIWKSRFNADASILERALSVNGVLCTVIGVMPPDMRFPANNDVWLPLSALPREYRASARDVRSFNAIGRLTGGTTRNRARAELVGIGTRLAHDYPGTNSDIHPTITTVNERVAGPQIALVFAALMGAVAFVLLIACTNVANLLLARAAGHSREIAVRLSLGAGRWRIVRQAIVESLLLSAVGGLLGLVLTVLGVRILDAMMTDVGRPYWMKFTVDPVVVAFLVATSVAASLMCGLWPALRASKAHFHQLSQEAAGRSSSEGKSTSRWVATLVVVEIILTLVLLAGAGFMIRSFLALYRMDLGIDARSLVTMRMELPLVKYPSAVSRVALFERLESQLLTLEPLKAGALTTHLPMLGGVVRRLALDRQSPLPDDRLPEVTMVGISPHYFDTLGLRLIAGRAFEDRDGTLGQEGAAIVNQRFVRMYFPDQDPLGHRITLKDLSPVVQRSPPTVVTIVGVAPTVRQRSVQDREPDPVIYLPYRADPQRVLMLMVRANGNVGTISSLAREHMQTIAPDLALFNIQTMDQAIAQQRWPYRIFGSMFAIFAVAALALSGMGLYAVTSYSVRRRTREIGMRMALGAQPGQVLWLIVRRGVVHLAIGLPIGIAAALGVGKILESVLVQGASDLPTVATIAAVMVFVSIGACVAPALRAIRLEPMRALRDE